MSHLNILKNLGSGWDPLPPFGTMPPISVFYGISNLLFGLFLLFGRDNYENYDNDDIEDDNDDDIKDDKKKYYHYQK